MRDEDLREEFAAWLRPVREADPPGLPVIRRRLRRRRRSQAAGGAAALAAAAGIAIAVTTTSGAARTPARPAGPSSSIPVTMSSPRPVQGGYRMSASYTVSSPVGALVVDGGVGTITITGSPRSTVSVSEQVTFSHRPPAMTRDLSGKTLRLGYTCTDCGVA